GPHSVKPESVFKMWKTRSKCGKLLRTVENSCGRGLIKLFIILHLLAPIIKHMRYRCQVFLKMKMNENKARGARGPARGPARVSETPPRTGPRRDRRRCQDFFE